MTPPRFHVDSSGRWSGGGQAFLENAQAAAARHPVLTMEQTPTSIPLVPRNVPTAASRRHRPYVLAPQNAWPWTPVALGLHEIARVWTLRVASEQFLRRAAAVLRISEAIPSRRPHERASPVLHNVLDPHFEEALAASSRIPSPWPGAVVSIGSAYAFRNVPTLVRAYTHYREAGGRAPLVVAGPKGSQAAARAAARAADGVEGVTLVWDAVPRPVVLAAFREAAAVVLPSRVEASSFTTIEALAMTPRVALGDIVGNHGILTRYAPTDGCQPMFFDPTDPVAMSVAISIAECGGRGTAWHSGLRDQSVRDEARRAWGDELAGWLHSVDLGDGKVIGTA